ncbi:metal-dependent hydrolase [Acinetobacter bereziniae]|uniref:metal-dependent hydrolase n=1 Tax=Acinetobacter TaxID=469 RepID=UPI000EF6CD08|nr:MULTISPECIES: metal-dependent hydrolase [Acinetobacter]MBJ8422342.1 metal-dependent hydrolase [Acinetobacter bereziniae]MCU4476074.1 metal-dependent hydrolase [Acinetobacter bereziniae]MCU4543364.1 metal-dependent hydrolase [Acinetobacter bereziniae]MCU4627468.1 metal-dependent hydrolase [Acinetobacter bereziniae]BCX72935.1 metal-dependent hydrolase [Acinetobacter sp. Tol 5]
MFVKPLKKAVAKMFAAAPFSLANQTPIIPIRHMKFDFDPAKLDHRFYMDAELASAYFASLSIFLTRGEDLVIDTARYHRDFITDPLLKQRVTSLIGQEAIHSKMHEELNEAYLMRDLPVKLFRTWAGWAFEYGFERLPQPMKLSLMAGIEHFTAVLAEYMMNHEEIFFRSQDEKQRAIWMWHMLEESEHKDIAFDVFQELSNNYLLRIAGFFPALITILVLISAASFLVPFYRNPKNLISLRYWSEIPYNFRLIFGLKDGVYGSSFKHIFDYLRPNFHPNDHDTSEFLEYYKEKLLNPENGILTPYLTKEFYPTLRS